MTDMVQPLDTKELPEAEQTGLLRMILRNALGLVSIIIIIAFVVVSLSAPWLAPFDPTFVDLNHANRPPFSSEFLLGGDAAGRDVLSRLIWAGRLSLVGAAVTVVVSSVFGVLFGLIAGYFRGTFDIVSNWLSDVLLVLPSKIILVALFAVIGPNTIVTMAVLGVMIIPSFYRLVRNLVIGVKSELYVDAAIVSGLPDTRILGRHILGVIRAPIIIQASFTAGIAVVIQAGLEFIGLGDPARPTWGGMLEEAFVGIYTAPSLIIWPGITIGLFVGSFVLLGNSLRDALEGGTGKKKSKGAKKGAGDSPTPVTGTPGASIEEPSGTRPFDPPASALLVVEDLHIAYPMPDGTPKEVVRGVSFAINRGEVCGLVGESGSGKSQTAFAVLGLLPPEAIVGAQRMTFDGASMIGGNAQAALRGRRISYIPQEPMSNLDPAFKIGSQLVEPMRATMGLSKSAARERALDLLDQVGISDPLKTFRAYPHEISGGMAQRVLIAAAISGDPELIIADEPTTALDVTIQAEILDILRDLQHSRDLAVLLVTHNFGVVADICDRIIVMQDGRFVEENTALDLFAAPQHPYTRMLLDSTLETGELDSEHLALKDPEGSTL